MALRRPSTRANPQRPLVTPVSDPEKIIRRGRDSQRQTSRYSSGSTSGISRGISIVISNKPPFQCSFAETYNSQEFIVESKFFRVEESSCAATCVDPIPSDSTKINLPKILSQLLPTPSSSPSAFSIPTSNMVSPLNKMGMILVAKYTPLNFPNPLSTMLTGYYLKYMPKFTVEGDFIDEAHL